MSLIGCSPRRAEYRILLRMDDADMRLTERAYQLGLAKEDRYQLMKSKKGSSGANRFLRTKLFDETCINQ